MSHKTYLISGKCLIISDGNENVDKTQQVYGLLHNLLITVDIYGWL